MAEVFRARPADREANGQIMVLKRILPHVAHDPAFLSMFKSEVQVSMGFNHPNTVQIHSFGTVDDHPYLTMEYIRGRNLRQLIQTYIDRGANMPIEMALYIVEQVARGLHYAHTFTNPATGETLNLVHRDVSPQNILISFDGQVKVIDFGIAKASVASPSGDATAAGTIKGKLNYLSPEQVTGASVDARSDIFSLGIVLWELLTHQRLFAGHSQQSELATIKLIENFEKLQPPSSINPQVPELLDRIVMMALNKNPTQRYSSAAEFEKVLRAFSRKFAPTFGPAEVSGALSDLYREEMSADALVLKDLNERGQSLLSEPSFSLKSDSTVLLAGSSDQTGSHPSRVMNTGVTPAPVLIWGVPGLTRQRVAAFSLYMLLIAMWTLDKKYFVLERFSMPSQQVIQATYNAGTRSMLPVQAQSAAAPMAQSPQQPASRPQVQASKTKAPLISQSRRFSSLSAPVRTTLLKVVVSPPSRSPTSIIVNDEKLDPRNPVTRVPMDQKVTIRIQRKDYQSVAENVVINSAAHKNPKRLDLKVALKRKR